MAKKWNGAWLFVLLLAVAAAGIFLWLYGSRTAGSFDGGILVELPRRAAGEAVILAHKVRQMAAGMAL